MMIGCTEVEEKVLALKKAILETGYIVYNEHLQKSNTLSL